MELDFNEKGKSLLNGSLESLFLSRLDFINKLGFLSRKISHMFAFEFRCQLRNGHIRKFVYLKDCGCYDALGFLVEGLRRCDWVLIVIRLMKHS